MPAPPAAPSATGASSSGGVIYSDGAVGGDFRGPRGLQRSNGAFEASAKTTPGAADDFVVTVAPGSDLDAPTMTITIEGNTYSVDFASPSSSGSYIPGLVDFTRAQTGFHVVDLFQLDGVDTAYSRLFYSGFGAGNQAAFATLGADIVDMPIRGAATFDTAVTGLMATPLGVTWIYSRNDVTVDFGAGTVSGSFDNIVSFGDWLGGFEMSLDAQITGDDFSGTMSATDGAVFLTGPLEGDFYGPLNQAPTEIGGGFVLEGGGYAGYGGFLGKAD